MTKATGIYCRNCTGRMFTGQQYYAFQKNYIDLTCIRCSASVDVEINKLNRILSYLGFKTVEARHDLKEANSK
jgi:DNA-directed RNA polymerase subunit RPC12/RpoP